MGLLFLFVVLIIVDLVVVQFFDLDLFIVRFFDLRATPLTGQVVEHITQGAVGSRTQDHRISITVSSAFSSTVRTATSKRGGIGGFAALPWDSILFTEVVFTIFRSPVKQKKVGRRLVGVGTMETGVVGVLSRLRGGEV